jgi:hypothetical protein
MLKKLPAVFVGLLLALSAYAAANVELNPHHPDTYTVQKGDTLWSIAARFLQGPWQWPEVWQANPQVHNPHLIYPGDVINLVYVNGQPRLVVDSSNTTSTSSFGPHARATQLEDAIKPIPLEQISDFLKRPRMISEDEFRHAPHVVAFEDDHLRGVPGQLVYVRGLDAQPGQQFAVLRPLGRYYEFTSKDADRPNEVYRQSLDDRDDRPSMLWHRGPEDFTLRGNVHFAGYEMLQFATIEVTHTGKVTSTLLLNSDFEVRPGDFVLPLDTMQYDSQYVPHSPRQVPAHMHVLAFSDALNAVGRLQVVGLSNGAADGVENGQVYSVFHQGDPVHDDLDYPDGSTKAFLHPGDAEVQLPEEYIGHVMIFRTFEHVSYALVMDGVRPVHIGDRLYEPDHR